METYNPHFVARKFELSQSLSFLISFSYNSPFYTRIVCGEVKFYEKLIEVYGALKKNLHLCPFSVHPCKTPLFTNFWDAFYFKHLCLLSNEVMNIQIWELTNDRAFSSLQGYTKMRGEFIREIHDFESFYHFNIITETKMRCERGWNKLRPN